MPRRPAKGDPALPQTVKLINYDWDRVAEMCGDTLGHALARHTLAATRDVKAWENTLLKAEMDDLENNGVEQWLETTKRGLGIFLHIDSAGNVVISGVEHPSSASDAGVEVGALVAAINGRTLQPQDGSSGGAVAPLLGTVCHRNVELSFSSETVPDFRRWQHFEEFDSLSEGQALVTIEHCCCCEDHQDTTRHEGHRST